MNKEREPKEIDSKIMSDILLAIIEWMKELPKNKSFLEEMQGKQEKKLQHPPFP